nr:TaqI-like C-terminal specificity domain-containing protein [Prevotella denticola]
MVIGNPPYISIQGMPMDMRRLYKSNFSFFFHRYDIFGCFIEHGLKILANAGILTFIQPSVFLNSKSFALCRKYLVEHCSILRLDVLQDGVFKAIVPTMIMSVSNKRPDKQIVSCADGIKQSRKGIAQTRFATTEANVFNVNLDEFASGFIDKTQTDCVFLGDIARISNGINTGNLSAYIHDEPHKKRVPVVKGASIAKWKYSFQNKYLDKSFDEFVSCGDIETLSHEKLMMKRIGVYPTVCYDNSGMACLHTIHTIRITDKRFSPKYVMALLNTKLIGYIFRLRVPLKGKVFPEFRVFDLNKQIPIKITSRKEQAEIVKYVNEILAHEDEITMLEEKINQCVYSLYGLTENEVEMVEETYRR